MYIYQISLNLYSEQRDSTFSYPFEYKKKTTLLRSSVNAASPISTGIITATNKLLVTEVLEGVSAFL